MTGLTHVATHVPASERDVWEAEAEEMGASLSVYVQMMAIAGRKKFDRRVEPDRTRADLRREIGRLMKELEERDETIKSLRRQLKDTEQHAVIDFVAENPGASYGDVRQHLMNTNGGRIASMLAEMEGAELHVEDGKFYATRVKSDEGLDD
ncbi:hypothetical protein PM035_12865 [Halorubrum ezzemoulense]|uniref:hypothetical protein n=1 Tax=Halorubrum ezzemoulense TaxID=337243 RepID=UPI00232C25AC|nr:hypothetical protein [Halorubrum ezzemoulense]MDB2261817.1 hypothetical protein [Halorubrum ezzemoulense]MDB2268579.1 hypothetical protein [Halorubrum ezzemoulense]